MRKYLIIGGSKGIGNALVNRLAGPESSVYVVARSSGDLTESNSITTVMFDVLSEELPDIDSPLEGMAYCPGSINLKPFNRLTDEDFQGDLNINLFGAIKTIRKYLPNLKNAGSSSILLFSTVAVQTGMGFHASIAAAKGALEGLTRSLAAEFAPSIRVNCIAPSLTQTPLAESLTNTPEKTRSSAERHPLKRIGRTDDIAELGEFLLSERSSWITGQVFHVDGGIGSLR